MTTTKKASAKKAKAPAKKAPAPAKKAPVRAAAVPAKPAQKTTSQAAASGKAQISEGTKVTVNYTGTFPNGVEFDKGEFSFTVGGKQVVPGFEANIRTMKQGEQKKFQLEPKDAYGEHQDNLVQEIPMEAIEKIKKPGVDISAGKTLALMGPNGEVFPVLIKAVSKTGVVLDMNHPMAGKTLVFDVRVVKVE